MSNTYNKAEIQSNIDNFNRGIDTCDKQIKLLRLQKKHYVSQIKYWNNISPNQTKLFDK